jgi:hypothetical protein
VGSADFAYATGSLSLSAVNVKVTTGTTKPSGGGDFARVAHSLDNVVGAVASYITQVGFNPMTKGCDVSVALCRLPSGGTTGWSVFAFNSLTGNSVNDHCYMLGLSDSDPSFITLRKGALVLGLPEEEPLGPSGVLRVGTVPVPIGQWVHLRLEAVTQTFGDVFLNVWQNDLDANLVSSPVWEEVPGLERDYNDIAVSFIDDALGINTGSAPLVGGRAGVGLRVEDVTRRCAWDHVAVLRQVEP